jgi:flagellar biosynthesis protein FliR
MSLEPLTQFVPTFVLVVFRLAGMMLAAPFFGSARIPRRVKLACALVIAAGITGHVPRPALPDSAWMLAVGIGGEMVFGLAIGTALSFTFIAVNWAGEIIGQQLGFSMGAVFDPQFGQSQSVVGDLYFMLTLVIFLIAGGHRTFLRGVFDSFSALPLLSLGMDMNLLDLVTGLLTSALGMAIRLAGPTLVTMLVVDVVLGFLGRTVPQINVMTAGVTVRSLVGLIVLAAGMAVTSEVIRDGMLASMDEIVKTLT